MCSNGSDMKELYGQVSGLFDERCSQVFEKLYKINDNETEKVIQTYLESRREYDDRKKVIDHILNYLNNSWVYKSINTGVPDVYKVRVKADVIWRTSMFSHGIHQKLTSSILSLITADRTGGIINEAAIKSCVNDFCKNIYHTKATLVNIFNRYFFLSLLLLYCLKISLDSTLITKRKFQQWSTQSTSRRRSLMQACRSIRQSHESSLRTAKGTSQSTWKTQNNS